MFRLTTSVELHKNVAIKIKYWLSLIEHLKLHILSAILGLFFISLTMTCLRGKLVPCLAVYNLSKKKKKASMYLSLSLNNTKSVDSRSTCRCACNFALLPKSGKSTIDLNSVVLYFQVEMKKRRKGECE
jgi:hypothetical protein